MVRWLVLLCVAGLLGCGPGGPVEPPRPSANASAQKISVGMTLEEVEKSQGSGVADGSDPNIRNYPTEDGNVIVRYVDGKVSEIATTNDR